MKKISVALYTTFVILLLIGIALYFGYKIYQYRDWRIADFSLRANRFTHTLKDTLTKERNIDLEIKAAESIIRENSALVAIQVYSNKDGLRFSVVKPKLEYFSKYPLAESSQFDSLTQKIRYQTYRRSLDIESMPGLDAYYIISTISGIEIRNYFLLLLLVVLALFAITLFIIFMSPRRIASEEPYRQIHESFPADSDSESNLDEENLDEENFEEYFSDDLPSDEEDLFSSDDFDSDEEFSIPEDDFDSEVTLSDIPDIEDSPSVKDFAQVDSLDKSDLLSSNPDFGESLPMDEDLEIPGLQDDFLDEESTEDMPSEETPRDDIPEELLDRMELELERAISFDQDLSLLLFSSNSPIDETVRDAYVYKDLVFLLNKNGVAVIEVNKPLDDVIDEAGSLIREITENSDVATSFSVGISSRNNRTISAQRFFSEAEEALRQTTEEQNIVAFKADPEKFQEYINDSEV